MNINVYMSFDEFWLVVISLRDPLAETATRRCGSGVGLLSAAVMWRQISSSDNASDQGIRHNSLKSDLPSYEQSDL